MLQWAAPGRALHTGHGAEQEELLVLREPGAEQGGE